MSDDLERAARTQLALYYGRLYAGVEVGVAAAVAAAAATNRKRDRQDWEDGARAHRVELGEIVDEAAAAGVSDIAVKRVARVLKLEQAGLAQTIASELKRTK